jgi:hypothetical protein
MHQPRSFVLLLISALCAAASPATAGDCLGCHKDIARQLQGSSHHIQGVSPSGRHCFACHWEATATGEPDERYHRRDPGQIELVIWKDGARPEEHTPGVTALTYSARTVGTEGERAAFAGITRHCLSCHNERTGTTPTFAGDSTPPGRYAWDKSSIDSRYSDRGVTTWGKYSTATSNRKMGVKKAFSAHGNAAANAGGWSPTEGYDGRIPNSREGARTVECFDCHNAHGSTVSGVTTSYRTAGGTFTGGILKNTTTGRGGYTMTYAPAANSDPRGKNPYSPGAGLCFDCHETATSGSTPWGYRSTFGVQEPIMGYKDTHRFGPGMKGSTSRYTSRQGRSAIVSSHLKAGAFLRYSATASINGLCTPCHDPHGVSPTLGEKKAYAVPLLKGTWLTSPYREDAPPSTVPGPRGPSRPAGPQGTASGSSRGPVSLQGMQYNVDRNTFGPDRTITETAESFAGLCLRCHNRLGTADGSKIDRIHRSVKGWGENREHAFPCAKCHQAHNSGLPRLMQTNCFEEGPAGLRENIGLSWLPARKGEAASEAKGNQGGNSRKTGATDLVGCHVRQFGRGGGAPRQNNQWQEKSKW